MNEEIISKIVHELLSKNPRFGTCSAEFQFHDNRITCYSIVINERHNLKSLENVKEKKNEGK